MHARLVGNAGMMCWEIPEENETATSNNNPWGNFHESADDFIPASPKNPSPESTKKLGVSGWVQWKARGYVTPKKRLLGHIQ